MSVIYIILFLPLINCFIASQNYIEITKPNMVKIKFTKALTDKLLYKDYIYHVVNDNKLIKMPLMINRWTYKFAYVYKDIAIVEDIDLYRTNE